ncbi:hypothetical protein D3C72_2265340 [compost metagenome]
MKLAMVPSMSVPLRLMAIRPSSLPVAEAAVVSGASFTGVTVKFSVLGLPVLVV